MFISSYGTHLPWILVNEACLKNQEGLSRCLGRVSDQIYIMVDNTYIVAVSRGYDTCFSVKACDGLYQLLKSIGSDWNTIWVSIDRVDFNSWYNPSQAYTEKPGWPQQCVHLALGTLVIMNWHLCPIPHPKCDSSPHYVTRGHIEFAPHTLRCQTKVLIFSIQSIDVVIVSVGISQQLDCLS